MAKDFFSSVFSLFREKQENKGKSLPFVEVKSPCDAKETQIDVANVFGVPQNRLDTLLLEFTKAAEKQGTSTIAGIRKCFSSVADKSLTANEFAAAIWVISSKCTESAYKREAFRSQTFDSADARRSTIM